MSGGSVEVRDELGHREFGLGSTTIPGVHGRRGTGGKRLRQAFFSLSALGGFVIGSAAIAIALEIRGRAVGLEDPLVLGTLALGAVVSGICGFITAAAYRELRNRRR